MSNILVFVLSVMFGIGTGLLLGSAVQQRAWAVGGKIKSGRTKSGLLKSVTKLIFVTTQVSALVWVFTSYGIAIYATVQLQQVYTMAELSEPAIHTILGVSFLKVLENVFEHNDGAVFGRSNREEGQEDVSER